MKTALILLLVAVAITQAALPNITDASIGQITTNPYTFRGHIVKVNMAEIRYKGRVSMQEVREGVYKITLSTGSASLSFMANRDRIKILEISESVYLQISNDSDESGVTAEALGNCISRDNLHPERKDIIWSESPWRNN